MNLAKWLFEKLHWNVEMAVEIPDKCVLCIAPHTSNWDFFYGMLFKFAYGIKAKFFIKHQWMRPPLGYFVRKLGGLAVYRHKSLSTTDLIANEFAKSDQLCLGITPEGTRSFNADWKKGFYYIAYKANVSIVLVSLDYGKKLIKFGKIVVPNGNIETQLNEIKSYYKGVKALYPHKFGF